MYDRNNKQYHCKNFKPCIGFSTEYTTGITNLGIYFDDNPINNKSGPEHNPRYTY